MKKRYILRVMRLLILFMLAGLMHVAAATYSQTVTIKGRNLTLAEVFKAITAQTGYEVGGYGNVLQSAKSVTVDFENLALPEAMVEILKGQQLDYAIEDKTIILRKKGAMSRSGAMPRVSENALPQDLLTITGKVTDTAGNRFLNATVKIKGTERATFTDRNGEFTLSQVAKDATIVISHIGYITQELPAAVNMAVILQFATSDLEEVAVTINTGYQNISKERFVGSYAKLDSAAFHRRAGMNILDRLDGTVPGLLFNKKARGGQQPIQIRGISTLGGGSTASSLFDPLIVVDNFPMDERFSLDNLNPNDVLDVTVLKDAAATSIWGSRAGNGVIVITTKKGAYNKPIQTTVSSNITLVNKPDLFYVNRVSPSDFIDIEMSLFEAGFYNANLNNNFTWPVVSPVVEILERQRKNTITEAEATAQINALRGHDLRNELNRYVYRQAIQQQHHVGISGGSQNLSYDLSVGYNPILNNVQGSSGDQQYTINTGVSYRPFKNFDIQSKITYGNGVIRSAPFARLDNPYPYLQLADAAGNPIPVPHRIRTQYLDTLNANLLDWRYRPLDEIRHYDNTVQNQFTMFSTSLNYRITPWLSASASFQHMVDVGSGRQVFNEETFFTRSEINYFTNPTTSDANLRHPVPRGGIVDLDHSRNLRQDARATLSANKTWGQHDLSLMAGSDISEATGVRSANRLYGYNASNGSYRSNIDFFNEYPWYYATFTGAMSTIPFRNEFSSAPTIRSVSFYGNGSYTFNEKYTLYGSARRDGANVFGVSINNRWKPLWSIGGKWQLSKESFFQVHWIDQLSLRGSFGYSGNTSNTAPTRLTISYNSTPAQFTNLIYASPGSGNNPELRWEQVGQTNIAADFSFFKNRLSGSLDLFQKISKDLISPYPIDPTRGVMQFPLNAASLKGRGFELTLQSRNLTGLVQWNTNAAVSLARTVVTEVHNSGLIAQDFTADGPNSSVDRLAFAMGSYRWAGLDPQTGDPMGYFQGEISTNYSAIANDSIGNQVYHGSSVPLYSAFFGNSVSYKGITLSFNLTGRFNFYFRKPALEISHTGRMVSNTYTAEYYQRWQQPGDEAFTDIPSMMYPVPSNMALRYAFYQSAEIHVMRGDNIRVQDIQLNYRLNNQKITQRFGIQNIDFFVYPNNLNIVLWRAAKTNWDPDYDGGQSLMHGPTPRTWTFGFMVGL